MLPPANLLASPSIVAQSEQSLAKSEGCLASAGSLAIDLSPHPDRERHGIRPADKNRPAAAGASVLTDHANCGRGAGRRKRWVAFLTTPIRFVRELNCGTS